jgi:hypothetical protein
MIVAIFLRFLRLYHRASRVDVDRVRVAQAGVIGTGRRDFDRDEILLSFTHLLSVAFARGQTNNIEQ